MKEQNNLTSRILNVYYAHKMLYSSWHTIPACTWVYTDNISFQGQVFIQSVAQEPQLWARAFDIKTIKGNHSDWRQPRKCVRWYLTERVVTDVKVSDGSLEHVWWYACQIHVLETSMNTVSIMVFNDTKVISRFLTSKHCQKIQKFDELY